MQRGLFQPTRSSSRRSQTPSPLRTNSRYARADHRNCNNGDTMKNFAEVLARSTQTEGWLSRHAAVLIHFFLSRQPAEERNILEIGVFKGKSAVLLAYETAQRDESLILLDIQIQPEVMAIAQLHPKIETIESD